jgi:hypothetical protein
VKIEVLRVVNPRAEWRGIPLGTPVILRYRDHVFFQSSNEAAGKNPRVMTAFGVVEYQDDMVVRVSWERYMDPEAPPGRQFRSTGLTILKSTIV